jgi:adenylosuccinate lyase
MISTTLFSIDGSPIYKLDAPHPILSEQGLNRFRLMVEIRWLQALANEPAIAEVPVFDEETNRYLETLWADFGDMDAQRVKEIEKTTKNGVKAVEIFLKERTAEMLTLAKVSKFIHFGCADEDIDNLACTLMLKEARETELLPVMNDITEAVWMLAHQYASQPMLSLSQGRLSTPTTVGKEFVNFSLRLVRQCERLAEVELLGKMNGTVGNYNAHVVAYPEVDWPLFARNFVETLGLKFNPCTTQIEPHDCIAEYFHALARINSVLADFNRDVCVYLEMGYFRQKTRAGQQATSPIFRKSTALDFEYEEYNLSDANALFAHLAEKLPDSRWQNYLTRPDLLNKIAVSISHSSMALQSTLKGLAELELNSTAMEADLASNWSMLAEPIRMVMLRYGLDKLYEKFQELIGGQRIEPEAIQGFIEAAPIPEEAKQRLLNLTPRTYTGLAESLAQRVYLNLPAHAM